MSTRPRATPAALAAVLTALVTAVAAVGILAATRSDPGPDVYVSIGDSYGAGFRPTTVAQPGGGTATTRDGFAYQVADRAAAAGRPVTLLNLACTGATSGEVLQRVGCPNHGLGPDAPDYPAATQADAAVAALRAHRGHVRLVTVVLGGNDVIRCLGPGGDGDTPAARACLDRALPTLATNLTVLLRDRIRAAAGPHVPVVGLTYPDVYLGGYVGDAAARASAVRSVALFRDRLNPLLRTAYAAAGASFLDITARTGGYDPLDRTVALAPYGRVPVPVARVCALTFYCSRHDLHPTRSGHALIADEILRAVPLAG